ncbi:MAG: ABC transporter ATP-binding protein [Myxococcales bacterium]|nr:ABC transporter ATP-binding protein [Myxococcales bacterium]
MLKFNAVTKRFGDLVAVNDLSFEVGEGEIFGFLGPNGAGKSTSVHMAVGVLRPDKGQITLLGKGDPSDPAIRSQMGVATQALALYEDLTARENVTFFAGLYGLRGTELNKSVDDALAFVGLTDRANDRVSEYSGGMKRRTNLAAAIAHKPKVLVLDEPTVGVDPQSRNAILDSVENLRKSGTTVVYTTHYMEEAQRLCDRVAIIDHGALLVCGTLDELTREHGGPIVVSFETEAGQQRVEVKDVREVLRDLKDVESVHNFSAREPNLETVFLNLTGRQLRD